MHIATRIALGLALVMAPVSAPAFAQSSKGIEYEERVSVKVGQSAVIYGFRGDCGKQPNISEITLPTLQTGTLSFGKIGQTQSKRCGGLTPAVEIVFTGGAKGRESFALNGDPFTVRVK